MTHAIKGSVVEGSVIEGSVELEKAWGPPTSNRRPPPRRIAKVCKSPIAVVRAAFKPMATGTELRGLRCVDRLRRRSCSWWAGAPQRHRALQGRTQFGRCVLRGPAASRSREFERARSIRWQPARYLAPCRACTPHRGSRRCTAVYSARVRRCFVRRNV